jgi:Polyketide cyclase / dehydrase and lipid transport
LPTREKDGTTVVGRIAIDPRKAGQDLRITASINIRRPVGEVFAFAGDYENDPLWRSGVVEMRYETPGALRAGARTREIMRFPGGRVTTLA